MTVNAITPTPDNPEDNSYQVSSDRSWTVKAFESLQSGDDLHGRVTSHDGVIDAHVWGKCPRCKHDLDDQQTLSALTSLMGVRGLRRSDKWGLRRSRKNVREAVTQFAQVDVSCRCNYAHPGAPTGAVGCGTSFRIELPVQEADARSRP
jgi:hypothetical protein